jgi:hypothetical protein
MKYFPSFSSFSCGGNVCAGNNFIFLLKNTIFLWLIFIGNQFEKTLNGTFLTFYHFLKHPIFFAVQTLVRNIFFYNL